jgi:hypothetical protein
MRNELPRRGLMRGALVLVTVSLLAACGSNAPVTEEVAHTHAQDSADGANVDVSEYLPHAGLVELGRASDLVVSGRVVSVADGFQIGTDPGAEYTIVAVAVDEAVKGSAPARTVEVAMLTRLDSAPVVFEGRPVPKADDRGVWLLRAIAPEFQRKGYVLTNQNGQVLAGKDGVAGGESSSRFAREVRQAGDLATVLNRLRAAIN